MAKQPWDTDFGYQIRINGHLATSYRLSRRHVAQFQDIRYTVYCSQIVGYKLYHITSTFHCSPVGIIMISRFSASLLVKFEQIFFTHQKEFLVIMSLVIAPMAIFITCVILFLCKVTKDAQPPSEGNGGILQICDISKQSLDYLGQSIYRQRYLQPHSLTYIIWKP